jgi:hypothetical protein
MNAENGPRLADDGEPAQPYQRTQPEHADLGITHRQLGKEVLRH